MKKQTFLATIFLWVGALLAQAMDEIVLESSSEPIKVCVFCSADDKIASFYKDESFSLGVGLASMNATLITGGSKTGLMKSVVDGFTTVNQKDVYGVLPEVLKPYKIHHDGIPADQQIWTANMYERLATFHKMSNTCIILPGGFGTLHELMDFLVSDQFGIHKTTMILASLNGYWDHLLLQFRRMMDEKTLAEKNFDSLKIAHSIEEVLLILKERDHGTTHNGLNDHFWEEGK